MEKNFILSVGMSVMFLFISSIKTVQAQQLGIGVKTELNGKVRFCNYDEAYFMPDTNTRIKVTGLEIAYDSSLNYYDIFVNVKGDKVNLHIKYSNGGEGAYIYKGIDRISKMDVNAGFRRCRHYVCTNLYRHQHHHLLYHNYI